MNDDCEHVKMVIKLGVKRSLWVAERNSHEGQMNIEIFFISESTSSRDFVSAMLK